MQFKYFLYPDAFAIWHDNPIACDFCQIDKKCFDGNAFKGEDKFTAICPECLTENKLQDMDAYACEGDIVLLQQQLQSRKPEKSEKAVMQKAGEITDALERCTPPIFTHQNWYWPCDGSDYCSFLGYGSKPLYIQLANDGDGEDLLLNSLYHTVENYTDVDEIWEHILPKAAITSLAAAKLFNTLFYVFVSQKTGRVVTLWDKR
ncbi:MAG: hypothetical protein GC192_01315 [Bacteroidetes bacterium]|nr:hypothetical protein [Bacteroidota bacterium]